MTAGSKETYGALGAAATILVWLHLISRLIIERRVRDALVAADSRRKPEGRPDGRPSGGGYETTAVASERAVAGPSPFSARTSSRRREPASAAVGS